MNAPALKDLAALSWNKILAGTDAPELGTEGDAMGIETRIEKRDRAHRSRSVTKQNVSGCSYALILSDYWVELRLELPFFKTRGPGGGHPQQILSVLAPGPTSTAACETTNE